MDIFSDLIRDTNFTIASEGSLMHSREKIETPLYAVNCILGGGIPLGVISEASGPPGSGKSTFAYQVAGIFQRSYENGIVIILDQESSVDISRLRALGVDPSKVLRLPATTMENAFRDLFIVLEKISSMAEKLNDCAVYIIYDTISTGGTEKQHKAAISGESILNAGGMVENARILKQNLANLFPYLERFPMSIILLNQVFTQIGGYISSVGSGGGYGLKHAAHLHLSFSKGKEVGDDGFLLENRGAVTIDKSKLSPRILDIPCNIDITKGGVIDKEGSFYDYITKTFLNIIESGPWNNMQKTIEYMEEHFQISDSFPEKYRKSFRKSDILDWMHSDENLILFLQIRLIDFVVSIYSGQRSITEIYKNMLVNKCDYIVSEKGRNE